jgi:hypothetical protein
MAYALLPSIPECRTTSTIPPGAFRHGIATDKLGLAGFPGYAIQRGDKVEAIPATNHPDRGWYVHRLDCIGEPGASIWVTDEELKRLMMDCNEWKARAVGNRPAMVRGILLEQLQSLRKVYRDCFKRRTFDRERLCLVSDTGRFELRWSVRLHPDRPISVDNQQTSIGCVTLHVIAPTL